MSKRKQVTKVRILDRAAAESQEFVRVLPDEPLRAGLRRWLEDAHYPYAVLAMTGAQGALQQCESETALLQALNAAHAEITGPSDWRAYAEDSSPAWRVLGEFRLSVNDGSEGHA